MPLFLLFPLQDCFALLAMTRHGAGIVGYYLQTAVDTDHHLIVTHEVTNVGSDRRQLTRMAQQARAELEADHITLLADEGYYNGDELRACEDSNITAYVPHSSTSNNKARGQFDRSEFHYIEADDEYEWPAGERLIYRFTRDEKGELIRRYWASALHERPISNLLVIELHEQY